MSRVGSDRDPQWLRDLDARCQEHLGRLLEVPPTAEADADKMRDGMLQTGVAIVEPFRHWLTNMKQRAQPGTPEHEFLADNEEEETLHWEWWKDMAVPFGVEPEDFERVTVTQSMRELSDYLDGCSRTAPLPVAIAAVNYCIETAASQMTAAFSGGYADRLGDRAGQWVKAHREGDIEHSRTARELMARLAGDDVALQEQASQAALKAYDLFYRAMADVMPPATRPAAG